MIRSILAVVAGYLAMFIGVSIFFAGVMFLALGGMPAHPESFTPPRWLFILEQAWTPLPAIAGGYVCAWIARRFPMRHAAALVAVMVPLSVVSMVMEAGMKPLW